MAMRPPTIFKNWSWPVFWSGLRLAIVAGLFLLTVRGMRPDTNSPEFRTLALARDHLFDFAQWEGDALFDKALIDLVAPQGYMSPDQRLGYVRDYLKLVGDIDDLENRIETLYADPAVSDPAAASADLRARRDALRAEQSRRQALAESIIQSQVAEMLVEYGFGTGGQVLPPVEMRFTQLPTIMIVSRREKIDRIGGYPLEHGLAVEQQQSLEGAVDSGLDASTLIAPLGGLAVYPAMLIETSDIHSVYNISAHEWTHHYLSFYPLGFNYGRTPDLYTINETVASMVGSEIGWAVLHRYYPDLAGPPPDLTPKPPERPRPPQPGKPGEFVFQTQMRSVRVEVDTLLDAGKVEQAEDYMERARATFVAHGYRIRKLNQAYLAFYGSYADQPGATGSDPVGPALRELRFSSPSLFDFIAQVRGMTSLAEIQAALAKAKRQ
jgi:hypothetical protein